MVETLTAAVQNLLADEFGLQDVSVEWKRPQESSHGDLATPVALKIASLAAKSPHCIADAVVRVLRDHPDCEKVEVAGPGYVNVFLTPDALLRGLASTRKACTPALKREKEAPVIVEYSQPNIAKPLGVHHLLSTLIGQSIANMYEHAGYNTLKWNYIGDWGTQFGKLAVAVEKWGTKDDPSQYTIDELLALYVQFHDEAEKNESLEDEGRAAFRKLEEGDAAMRTFWEAIVNTTKASLGDLYNRLHVSFDLDLGESFYEDKMESLIEQGIEQNVFVEGKEGSLIVEFPEETNMPPYLVRKGDGATLYSTRDIAQMRYRMDTYHPQEILIVTDIAQKLHFEQLEATCDQLEWELPAFENVLVGRMRFADSSMSTRKGKVLKLEEVLDEAVKRADAKIAEHGDSIQAEDEKDLAEMMGVGSVAYGILSQNRKMDIVFDWDKFLSFEGNSAPYLQYTHARAKSVLRKADVETMTDVPADIGELSEKERILLNTLLQFETVLQEALHQHMPHTLAQYLYALAQDYNAFYNTDSILDAPEPARSVRLLLTSLTASVLKTGADILTIRLPDRM